MTGDEKISEIALQITSMSDKFGECDKDAVKRNAFYVKNKGDIREKIKDGHAALSLDHKHLLLAIGFYEKRKLKLDMKSLFCIPNFNKADVVFAKSRLEAGKDYNNDEQLANIFFDRIEEYLLVRLFEKLDINFEDQYGEVWKNWAKQQQNLPKNTHFQYLMWQDNCLLPTLRKNARNANSHKDLDEFLTLEELSTAFEAWCETNKPDCKKDNKLLCECWPQFAVDGFKYEKDLPGQNQNSKQQGS